MILSKLLWRPSIIIENIVIELFHLIAFIVLDLFFEFLHLELLRTHLLKNLHRLDKLVERKVPRQVVVGRLDFIVYVLNLRLRAVHLLNQVLTHVQERPLVLLSYFKNFHRFQQRINFAVVHVDEAVLLVINFLVDRRYCANLRQLVLVSVQSHLDLVKLRTILVL